MKRGVLKKKNILSEDCHLVYASGGTDGSRGVAIIVQKVHLVWVVVV